MRGLIRLFIQHIFKCEESQEKEEEDAHTLNQEKISSPREFNTVFSPYQPSSYDALGSTVRRRATGFLKRSALWTHCSKQTAGCRKKGGGGQMYRTAQGRCVGLSWQRQKAPEAGRAPLREGRMGCLQRTPPHGSLRPCPPSAGSGN